MGDKSKIEWTEATWNPIAGCTAVSPGCRNCYAARQALRMQANPNEKVQAKYEGTARKTADGRPVFTGRVNLAEHTLDQPLRWKAPRRIFVNSMSDLFHQEVPDEWIHKIFAVMALAPQHTFQILTKRPERMAEYLRQMGESDTINDYAAAFMHWSEMPSRTWPLSNVWVGTSVEDQERAEERIPHLLRCPAAVRFLSCEPLLGPVDLTRVGSYRGEALSALEEIVGFVERPAVDWVIVGGESGPGARPCDVEWIRSLVHQCREARIAVFTKQLGASWYEGMALVEPRNRKGGDPSEWPEDLQVREMPHG